MLKVTLSTIYYYGFIGTLESIGCRNLLSSLVITSKVAGDGLSTIDTFILFDSIGIIKSTSYAAIWYILAICNWKSLFIRS